MIKKKSILLYLDSIKQWDRLSDEQAGKLIKALLRYADTGENFSDSDGALEMMFSFIASQIDRDKLRWAEVCEKRRDAAVKRWQMQNNANDTNAYNSMQNNANGGDKDIDIDKDKDIDKVKDKDKDKDKDIVINNIYNTKEKKTSFDSMVDDFTENQKLREALKEFIKLRKALKSPLTDRALQLAMGKLDKLGATDEQKIAIIEQSIERGWKTLYPLKDEKEEQKNSFDAKKYEFLINNF